MLPLETGTPLPPPDRCLACWVPDAAAMIGIGASKMWSLTAKVQIPARKFDGVTAQIDNEDRSVAGTARQRGPLLAPDRIALDGASTCLSATVADKSDGLLAWTPTYYVTKHLQQCIQSDHFQVKKNMPRIGLPLLPHNSADHPGLRDHLWLCKSFAGA